MAQQTHFSDRLLNEVRRKGTAACVGFDPVLDKLPSDVRRSCGVGRVTAQAPATCVDSTAAAGAFLAFGKGVIDAVADQVAVIKINIAFFEPLYAEGIRVYHELVGEARKAGLVVIGDVKRADIGHTTAQYAEAQLGGSETNSPMFLSTPDAVTVNPYFGIDGVQPFIDRARSIGRGLFVLVQTSNESAAEVQGLPLADGSIVSDQVAVLVNRWANEPSLIGNSGYSCIGAVVSPRDVESTRRIRAAMPQSIFLVPGFGAQGRTAEEVAVCFKADGTGAIVNASRSVLYAFDSPKYRGKGVDWKSCITKSCRDFVDDLKRIA